MGQNEEDVLIPISAEQTQLGASGLSTSEPFDRVVSVPILSRLTTKPYFLVFQCFSWVVAALSLHV